MINRNISMLIIISMLGSVFLSGCAQESTAVAVDETSEKPVTVSVAEVTMETVESVITLNGKVRPVQEISIVPKVPGKVESVRFDVGQKVKRGDILFTLEDDDIRLQLNQAEAALTIANTNLSRVKGGALEQQLVQLKSAVVASETNYNNAKLNYERIKELFDAEAVSKQMFEAAESSYILAKDQYESAKSNLTLTQEKLNPESIAAAEAQVKQARAAYDIVKSQLDNTVIVSPIDGIVASKNAKVGEFVGTSAAAFSVIDLSSVDIDINVTEDMINKIKPDDNVKVEVKAAVPQILEGKIKSVSPTIDSRTQNYPVKINVENTDGILKGGMFAEVHMTVDKVENAVAVPLTAVVDDEGRKVVYVVNGDKAEKRNITVGFFNDRLVQVLDGLKEKEIIIVKGQSFVREGSKVSVSQN